MPSGRLTMAGSVPDTTYNSYFNLNPIPGTGPYVVTSASEDAYVIFNQSPTYWGDGLTAAQISLQPLLDPGHVKEAIIYYKPDDITRYSDLTSGAVQIAAILQDNWNLVQQNSAEFNYLTLPPWSALDSALGLNTQIYPTNITAVRQAIVHALNYTQIAQAAFLGEYSPYFGPEYPAWSNYYDPGNYSYQYNLTEAKADLTNAGINVSSLPTLSMNIVSEYPLASNLAQTVQSDLAQIGINVEINVQDSSVFYTPYGSYSYEVSNAAQIGNLVEYFGTWAADRLTAADDWITFVSNQSYAGNTAIYSNPVVQNAITALLSSDNVTYIHTQACGRRDADLQRCSLRLAGSHEALVCGRLSGVEEERDQQLLRGSDDDGVGHRSLHQYRHFRIKPGPSWEQMSIAATMYILHAVRTSVIRMNSPSPPAAAAAPAYSGN